MVFDLGQFKGVGVCKTLRPSASHLKKNTIAIGTGLDSKQSLLGEREIAFFFLLDHGIDTLLFRFFFIKFFTFNHGRIMCQQTVTSQQNDNRKNNFFHANKDMMFNVNLGKNSMTSEVVYEGGLRTTCTHLRSGNSFETDAPVDNNGKGERFSPTDLMATSLATCMITVMGIKARSMGFDLENVKIEVEKIMKSDPRRIGGINLFFSISGVPCQS